MFWRFFMVLWLLIGNQIFPKSVILQERMGMVSNQNVNLHAIKKFTDINNQKSILASDGNKIHEYSLKNGMKLLVKPVHDTPKVSIQMWYKVGSKNEVDGQRGSAHLLEHMAFKGTKKLLSESDINTLSTNLSAYCNAFTSYDYTCYVFDLPSQNWQLVLPVLADCMTNLALNDDMLNSEMKAVIQELKLYKDNYVSTLIDIMTGDIFADHPYHHPIIGYKQDLWTVTGQTLRAFYEQYYQPDNAALVIVGDVEPDSAYSNVQRCFEHITNQSKQSTSVFYHQNDLMNKTVTIYRDVQLPTYAYVFVIPGLQKKQMHIASLLDYMLGKGKNARLYKKLVNQLSIATDVSTFVHDLFDYGLFFIIIEPKNNISSDEIGEAIKRELTTILDEGFSQEELESAVKKNKMETYRVLEDYSHQATEIGKNFIAGNDPSYSFTALELPMNVLLNDANKMARECIRPTLMYTGQILPLNGADESIWLTLQEASDAQDEAILSHRIRESQVEPPRYSLTVKPLPVKQFNFPKASELELKNGMKVLYHNHTLIPKIELIIDFAAKSYYDSDTHPGLYNFMMSVITEGTKNYSAAELHHFLELRGIELCCEPGRIYMSMLSEDLVDALNILKEILTTAVFDEKEIEKVRHKIFADINTYWDDHNQFWRQLVKDIVYEGHPYQKNLLGTHQSVTSITRKELLACYNQYITPKGMVVSLVGDLSHYRIEEIFNRLFGAWENSSITPVMFPEVKKTEPKRLVYPINRDQAVLCFAGRSIERTHPDFDKLLLFDQIFGGGVLGSMSSQLFQLREESGLFYSIHGSFLTNANEQPGMCLIKTMVSMDRFTEAEERIKKAIISAADAITEQDVANAKNIINNFYVSYFATAYDIASTFLFLNKYKFPADYYDNRAAEISKISLTDIKNAVKNVLDKTDLAIVQIGRFSNEESKNKIA